MKDASTCLTTETKNESTSTSLVTVDREIQVEMEDSTLSVTIEGKNESTSSSVLDVYSGIKGDDEARCKTSLFDEIVRELPYDEKTQIIIFDKNLKDQNLSSNMVSLITAPKKWKVVICLKIVKFMVADIINDHILPSFTTYFNIFEHKYVTLCSHIIRLQILQFIQVRLFDYFAVT